MDLCPKNSFKIRPTRAESTGWPVRLRGLRKGVSAALTVHRPFSLNAKVDSLKKFHHP
jgi:hypothetical protein